MPITTAIFDAYGTLFDVNAAARAASEEPDFPQLKSKWQSLAANWRTKQLQYTWLRAVADQHIDFWTVTQHALDWALDAAELASPELRDRLLALYWELDAYAEVPEMLSTLKSMGLKTGILSNGSPDMLDGAVASAGLDDVLDEVLSVETVHIFKPATPVYDLVAKRFNTSPEQVLFVSSNGWDAAAAAHYGFETVWVNRTGEPIDRLYGTPSHMLPDLSEIPELIRQR